ncbi:hypothetical protein FQN54_002269 [Arachnomyces sp. PD_36]|nr:hypothetical protein FQN54_002269 [Arachnomyces sp. PD_36]
MFAHGSLTSNRIVKACRAKFTAASERRRASKSSHGSSAKSNRGPGTTTRRKSSLRNSLQNLAIRTINRQRYRRRRQSGESNTSLDSALTSSTFSPSNITDLSTSDSERESSSPTPNNTSHHDIAPTLQSQQPTPGPSNQIAHIHNIPPRYKLRIRQLSRDATQPSDMVNDNKTVEGGDAMRLRGGGGLPRSTTSYRLSGSAWRGSTSSIPLPSSSSTNFASSTTLNRRSLQLEAGPSCSQTRFPARRPSIVQRGDAVIEEEQGGGVGSGSGPSTGATNIPRVVEPGKPAVPQRQLMRPLGPPFPRSQTLVGPVYQTSTGTITEKKVTSKSAKGKEPEEVNSIDTSYDMCEVKEEEVVEVLKKSVPLKSEIESERKWKKSALERLGNKVGVETEHELPAQAPAEGGWLWDVPEEELVRSGRPQEYWFGRFVTLMNRFNYEDSFNEPDSATGMDKMSGLSRPTSLSKAQLDEHRIKRTFVALESMCVTPEATESFREFKTAYCRRFGDQWTKWLVVGRGEDDTGVLGEMSRVFLKRGERRTPEPRSERKISGSYGEKFGSLFKSMRRSLA